MNKSQAQLIQQVVDAILRTAIANDARASIHPIENPCAGTLSTDSEDQTVLVVFLKYPATRQSAST